MKKIVYIGGIGHSGSTLLDMVLGAGSNAVSCGQIGDFYNVTHDLVCSCGEKLKNCEFWSYSFGQFMSFNDDEKEILSSVDRERSILRFLFNKKFSLSYSSLNSKMLSGIEKEKVIVDSSKNLSRLIALTKGNDFDVRYIHLIRDSRGYINSYNKRRVEAGKSVKMIKPFFRWILKNSTASIIGKVFYSKNYLKIKYEDLIADPVSVIQEIGHFTSIETEEIVNKIKGDEDFSIKHIFSGNRVSKKTIKIKQNKNKQYNLNHFSEKLYWYFFGFVTRMWGYKH